MNAQVTQNKVIVIGHRGASALRPEHTLASYIQAVEDGADFIEPDLVMTLDGVLIARHENEISATTDVASHPEFAARKCSKTVDGQPITGWFSEDFSLAELKKLRARERLPQLRCANVAFDGAFEIPTLDEIIKHMQAQARKHGRTVGIYPEIKHSSHFAALGLAVEDKLLDALAANPYTRNAPVFIQSFETANLLYLNGRIGPRSNVRLIQLLGEPQESPFDCVKTGQPKTYAELMQPKGLMQIAQYADAIGPNKLSVIPRDANGALGEPTTLVADAHAQHLLVHAYTFRGENFFLPSNLRQGSQPALRNDAGSITEIRTYLDAGIDGFFADDPALGRKAVDAN